MLLVILKQAVSFRRVSPQSISFVRYVRGVSRSGNDSRLLKASVKNAAKHYQNEYPQFEDFSELVKHVKTSSQVDEVEIENALSGGGDFGEEITSRERKTALHRENPSHRSFIKKAIIGRKYFKSEIETCLLTHAAKEQIRYLNQMDPLEWNPDALAQSFPVTVSGVKKLLKSNYVLKSPLKIKLHDEEVANRWTSLKSGESSDLISSHTQHLWDAGKIFRENYQGNPNLPTGQQTPKLILKDKKKEIGEFEAIVQKYVEYKKGRELKLKQVENSEKDLQVLGGVHDVQVNERSKFEKMKRQKYVVYDETDDLYHDRRTMRKIFRDVAEVSYSQFKENLKEEISSSKFKSEYEEWAEQQPDIRINKTSKPFEPKNFFTKIPKYNTDSIELKQDKSDAVYLYDEKLGYQHPKGKNIKGKIRIPESIRRKDTTYKVGQCVYDEDGELLYKLPS